jgi:hypothetical protein
MNLKPNDSLRWEAGDGILKEGQLYLVWQTREGARGQEFTLKYPDWWMVEPVIWWEFGEPFTVLESVQREAA